MATKEIRIKQVEAIKRLIERNDFAFRSSMILRGAYSISEDGTMSISTISDNDYNLYILQGCGHWMDGSPLFKAILTLNMHGHERDIHHPSLDKWKCGVYPSKK